MGVCVRDLESRGWERRERGDGSVWVCERERVGDGRGERESRGWEREEVRESRGGRESMGWEREEV